MRKKTAAANLLLAGIMPLTLAAADVSIEAGVLKSNGITLNWSNSAPGYAYTLQYRASASSGAWSNVWTRYRWPGVMTRWTEPTRVLTNAGFYRVVAEPIQAPQRGKILSVELLHTFPLTSVLTYLNDDGFPTADARWPANYYQVVYETVDPSGLPIQASGGLYVPLGVTNAMPLLSYQHGTEIYKPRVPSQETAPDWYPKALFYASSGYVTVLPDYLGLGESPGLHPYLHANTEATAVVDMLRAVKTFCATNNITLNSQLFLAGYSQGGHATAAAHRAIERDYTNEFTVTASAPMAGPYFLSGGFYYTLTNTAYPAPGLFIVALAAWLPIYDLADTLEELLAPPYDQTLPPLLDGNSPLPDLFNNMGPMGPDVQSMLAPGFLDALLNNPNHPFWQAAAANDLLDWAPQAPMHLFHCSGDTYVGYPNSLMALQAYTTNGACCVELVDPTPSGEIWDHFQGYKPSLIGAKAWFDTMKQ